MAQNKEKNTSIVRGVTVNPPQLPKSKKDIILQSTPQQFIKNRPIRGGGNADYVEIGYVVNMLNLAFSPVGWDFEIIKEEILENEVWVKGKLTIKDYKSDYSVAKTQFGTKERVKNVPLGDILKSAGSDCLKKCASLVGIASDVYWQEKEEVSNVAKKTKVKIENKSVDDIYEATINRIKKETDLAIVREILKRTIEDEGKIFKGRDELKTKIITLAEDKIAKLQ